MTVAADLKRASLAAEQGHLSDAAKQCLEILRNNPTNIDAMVLYGELAIDLRLLGESVIIFQKLLQVSPRHVGAHERLAKLCLDLADLANAEAYARAALKLDTRLYSPHLVLGSILLSRKEKAAALAEFELARGKSGYNLEVEVSYVDALLIIGEFNAAAKLLRHLIGQHPDYSPLHFMLAHCGKLLPDHPDVTLIRSLADSGGDLRKDVGSESSVVVPAYMALFKVASDLQEHGKAFDYLQRAKGLKIAEMPYDEEKQREHRRRLKDVYNADFFRHRPVAGFDEDGPIFVVGMPRSGTTLLERVLTSSPDIAAAGELSIVSRLAQEVCADFGHNQYDLDAVRKVPEALWSSIGEEYIRRARQALPDTRYFVDKLPGNYLNLGFIKTMLPRARIIHLSRHPVATCLSLYEQEFANAHAYSNDLVTLGEHYLGYRKLMDYWGGLFGGQIIELTYELLVSDTAVAMELLSTSLGVELDSFSVGTAQHEGDIRSASLWQARQPIHKKSVERWQLLRKELRPLLDTLAPILEGDTLLERHYVVDDR